MDGGKGSQTGRQSRATWGRKRKLVSVERPLQVAEAYAELAGPTGRAALAAPGVYYCYIIMARIFPCGLATTNNTTSPAAAVPEADRYTDVRCCVGCARALAQAP